MSINRKKNLKRSALALAVAFSLAGCSSTDSDSEAETRSTKTLVADGYIKNAKVCFDTDLDGSCAEEEYVATTDENGVAVLDAPSSYFSLYPLIAELLEGISEDMDRGLIGTTTSYSAPIGNVEFLTPLTTLVRHEQVRFPTLDDDALEAKVKVTLNVPDDIDLFVDHIDRAITDDAYVLLGVKAELVHDELEKIETTLQKLDAELDTTEERTDSVSLQLALDKIETQIELLLKALDDAIEEAGSSADYEELAINIHDDPEYKAEVDKEFTPEDVNAKLEEIQEAEKLADVSSGDIRAALQTGIYAFDFDGWYEQIKLSEDGAKLEFNEYEFNDINGLWEVWVDDDGEDYGYDGEYCLASNGEWVQDNSSYGIAFNVDNTATVTETCGSTQVKIQEIDLATKSWFLFTDIESDSNSSEGSSFSAATTFGLEDNVFSAGAKAYLLSGKTAEDIYYLYAWGNMCSGTGGNCNAVQNPANYEYATSFDELFQVADASSMQMSSVIGNGDYSLVLIGAAGDTTGVAHKLKYMDGTMQNVGETTWKIETINGVKILSFPELYNYDGEQSILIEQDGFVRQGSMDKAEDVYSVMDEEVMLNKAALDQIKADSQYMNALGLLSAEYTDSALPLAVWQLDSANLTFSASDECTGTNDVTKVSFQATSVTGVVDGTLVETCNAETTTSALKITDDADRDNVLKVEGTDNGEAYVMRLSLISGNLMSGQFHFVELDSEGAISDSYFESFEGMCTEPKMWNAEMGHCM